ncbi:hypothetical protein [Enterobacter sp.]|uniref:hypothetical protein n=1 Tax=Enterobacter sp. TaxID=42895 RepID=UPI00296F6210|nr:hypothetical protein [Enterobacter sp.]
MELKIKSRKNGEVFSFWMGSGGGYIHLQGKGNPGNLGRQICRGGSFVGSALTATPETFDKVVRNWYRAYQRSENG